MKASLLKLSVVTLVIVNVYLLWTNYRINSKEIITAKRINIIDENGTLRMAISNKKNMPLPKLDGKEYPRKVNPAGIVFYDEQGNENGGIGLINVDKVGEQTMMIFDYSNSEAIGIGKYESTKGYASAGITILDKVPAESNLEEVGSIGVERLLISNDNKNTHITIKDTKGKARIILGVNSKDEAYIKILDSNGSEVLKFPKIQ